jgi:hypothetical protein
LVHDDARLIAVAVRNSPELAALQRQRDEELPLLHLHRGYLEGAAFPGVLAGGQPAAGQERRQEGEAQPSQAPAAAGRLRLAGIGLCW